MSDRLIIDLTGPASHVLVRQMGNPGLTIGPSGCDLVVDGQDRIHWDALDVPELVARGYPSRVRYEGGDDEIAAWATRRAVDALEVIATCPLDLDLSAAAVLQYLTLEPRGHRITVRLPSATFLADVTLVGDPADVEVVLHPDGIVPDVSLYLPRTRTPDRRIVPADGSRGARVYTLPAPLRDTEGLLVFGDPFDVPFDVRTLCGLPRLRGLDLRCSVAHLDALASIPLTRLELRYVPDLTGLPPLSTWPDLGRVVVWNSDVVVTERVRAELRRMPPDDGFSSASKGRDRAWFVAEYGLPFAAWPKRTATSATRAFRVAAKQITAATTAAECLAAVEAFIRAANTLPDIMTSERDDLCEAVLLLVDLGEFLDADTALACFDAVREF